MHLVSSELRLGMTENPICIQKGFLEEAALRESLTGVGRSEPCVCVVIFRTAGRTKEMLQNIGMTGVLECTRQRVTE